MTRPLVHATGIAVLAALLLAGCNTVKAESNPRPPATSATSSATPTPTQGSSATPPTAAPPAAPPTDAQPTERCLASGLSGTIDAAAGGAAGSLTVQLVLTNTGTATCDLQGWPGVSLVGNGNGTQLGSAAAQDRSATNPHETVHLNPGQAATAPLTITDATNIPAEKCGPASADGLRVYPPGSRQALFIPFPSIQACTSTKTNLLKVAALQPGS